jgi:hypothetical protein
MMSWKLKRASKGSDPHPQIRYGARPTAEDGQISALKLPMSALVLDIPEQQTGMPAFVTVHFSVEAGYGFVLARPDQEDETVSVVRSVVTEIPREMPYAWLALQDFRDLLRWREQFKAGVGVAPMPQKLPPIQGFYHDLHLPGPRWRFSAFDQWMM